MTSYSAKAAVHHLTRSPAAEWAEHGVRVNAVAPTCIDTPLHHAVEGVSNILKAFRGIVAGAAGLALAGALSSAALAQNTPIKLSLDWKFEGPAAPFFVALEKGYFTEEGLDVTIDSGAGSLEPINRVASGTYQMGFGDINSLIKLRDQDPGAPVQAIYMVYDKPAFAIVGRKSQGVAAPKDLEGKTLGAPAPDGAYAQWPIFARANGIDAAKVRIENVGFPVREPMLAQGRVDAITGFSFSCFINLKAAGVPEDDISVMLMADHGVALYGNAIIVNTEFAEANPEAVKGFLRAFNRGVKETIADPAASVEYVVAANPVATKEAELERLQMAIDQNILTEDVKTKGLGGIDPERMSKAIDQLALTYEFKEKPTAGDVFDPSYLPEASERAIE